MTIIPASSLNVIATYDDGEMVAALSPNGRVALFSLEGDDAFQVSGWTSNPKKTAKQIADEMMSA